MPLNVYFITNTPSSIITIVITGVITSLLLFPWRNYLFRTSIGYLLTTCLAIVETRVLSVNILHDWCNEGCGMCYPVSGMMHIKEPLLLIGMSSPCGGSGFPLSLSEWSFTI